MNTLLSGQMNTVCVYVAIIGEGAEDVNTLVGAVDTVCVYIILEPAALFHYLNHIICVSKI